MTKRKQHKKNLSPGEKMAQDLLQDLEQDLYKDFKNEKEIQEKLEEFDNLTPEERKECYRQMSRDLLNARVY